MRRKAINPYKYVYDDLINFYRKYSYLDFVVNPRISERLFEDKLVITTESTFFTDENEYIENYSTAYENDRYLFALKDGSYFQINYNFQKENKERYFITKMNLCYLPPVEEDKIKYQYIRLDFSIGTKELPNSFFHQPTHLHIGFNEHIRLPFSRILLVSEFFELILFLFYPHLFKKIQDSCGQKVSYSHTIIPDNHLNLTNSSSLSVEILQYFYINFNKTY